MKKVILCISLALTGLMTACVDKNEAVDADNKPSWLGESIYQELKNPKNMEGTFSTYLRLIDDLGYSETLNRTGSMTIFPANDEAFQRFFNNNPWGVSNYEQLSLAQKKMLLYNSMLDNSMLVGMLSNMSNANGEGSVVKGMAMKHQTSQAIIDTIQHITSAAEMPQNNQWWDEHRQTADMYVVSDASQPAMVHFTREHMLNNGITTLGPQSDFAILTGTEYEDGMAYIFGDQIIKSDVTCQNGYIHQMQDVIVPPGNIAQVLRSEENTQYFSHILDYFCAPYENSAVTTAYNAWALENGQPTIDMIYDVRYPSLKSRPESGSQRLTTDPNRQTVRNTLKLDPGWNQYSPNQASGGVDYTTADVAALFAPTDQAIKDFFLAGGDGAYLIDLYGTHPFAENTEEHLLENLDALHNQKPEILTAFVNNLLKESFIATVPSKFSTIQNDANEYMGITLGLINRDNDRYDISIANNGVIYKMKELIAPDRYQSVMAPSSVYPDMTVMDWAINDDEQLGVSFHYYLMAMKANYAFFIPDDEAFQQYYVDPVYLKHRDPRALKFKLVGDTTTNALGDTIVRNVMVRAYAYAYDPTTNEVGNVLNGGAEVSISEWKSLFVDILNYHTVVLDSVNETFGLRKYYKTKHGGEIVVNGVHEGAIVGSGQQIDNGVAPSVIENVYNEKNGTAFRIDHIIQAPRNSVSATLQGHDQFSEFYDFCSGFGNEALLDWVGISSTPDPDFGIAPQDAYIIFTSEYKSADERYKDAGGKVYNACLDENVKMFNTYNYTLYAPNNDAMNIAYAAGLPSWTTVQEIYEQYADADSIVAAPKKEEAKKLVNYMRDFARYHFQSISVYADNIVDERYYNSLSTDEMGLALPLHVSGGGGNLIVTDGAEIRHTISANAQNTNLMCRDYWFNAARTDATAIYTSSFCVVHEISVPLNSGNLPYHWGAQ